MRVAGSQKGTDVLLTGAQSVGGEGAQVPRQTDTSNCCLIKRSGNLRPRPLTPTLRKGTGSGCLNGCGVRWGRGWLGFLPGSSVVVLAARWAGNGRVTGGWTGMPGRRLISPPVGPQPLWGGAWGGHFPPAARRGPPGFLERTRKCSRGWDLWLYPPVRESLDLLTSGEEML